MAAGAQARIVDEVSRWDGVTTAPGRFGSTRFLVGRRELGHLHGDALLDVPLPRRIQSELVAAGRVEAHRWVPESGWSSLPLRSDGDVADAIAVLRLQWERAAGVTAAVDDEPTTEQVALD